MKKIIVVVIILVLAAVVVTASNSGRLGKGYEKMARLPSVHSFPPLTNEEILNKAESGNSDGLLIRFGINSPVQGHNGYIFDNGLCILTDLSWASDEKKRTEEAILNNGLTPPPEYLKLLDEAPAENLLSYYAAEISKEDLTDLVTFLASQEIYVFEPGVVGADRSLKYGITIYIDNKIAGLGGERHSGVHGPPYSRYEGVNEAIYDYLTGELIPWIRENGTSIEGGHVGYHKMKIENLEKYPFALISESESPYTPLSGDRSLWIE